MCGYPEVVNIAAFGDVKVASGDVSGVVPAVLVVKDVCCNFVVKDVSCNDH